MASREELLASLGARLSKVAAEQDVSLVLELEAVEEGLQLAMMLSDDEVDIQARYLLAWLHWYRYQALPEDQDEPDFDAAVDYFTACFIAGMGEPPRTLRPTLAELAIPAANHLLRQAARATDHDVITVTVDLWQRIVDATPADDPSEAERWCHLGIALLARFRRTGSRADLDASVAIMTAAVDATPIGHDRAVMLSNLGLALRSRFEQTGDMGDLDAAIQAWQEAIDAMPADSPDRAMLLSNLGTGLTARFERTGSIADLEASIRTTQEVVNATPADHPERTGRLSNLGSAWLTSFKRTGKMTDLDAAIQTGRIAVEVTPADHYERALCLSNLAVTLRTRFERTGDVADIDAAVVLLREAVESTPADHPDWALYLGNLGNSLRSRFERTGLLADLDAAIQAQGAAVDATPAGHSDRAGRLSNMGISLRARFERTGETADLDTAIRAASAAVDTTPAGHPDMALRLTNLSGVLQRSFRSRGTVDDLDAAIEAGRTAAEITPAGHPDMAGIMTNLAAALLFRSTRTSDRADLDAAIQAEQEAVEAAPAGHAIRARCLINLGIALRTRSAPGDREAAASAFIEAAGHVSAAPAERIKAARSASGLLASSDPDKAADLLADAVRLLAEVAPRRLARADQQHAMREVAGLASTAAALALGRSSGSSSQRASEALGLLEAGRAVLHSQALDTRDDLTDLRRMNPPLAQRFTELRDRLDQPEQTLSAATMADLEAATAPGRMAEERREQAQQLADTLAEIRAMDGFASFGLPPTTAELLAQAVAGPIVTVNVHAYRSDALLLTTDGITSVELPALNAASLNERVASFHQALTAVTHAVGPHDRMTAQRTLTDILSWLWDTVAEPILDSLGLSQTPPPSASWPRVWWSPGGVLGLLPIHAAGYHLEVTDPRRTVMDRVISSYTPTIRALRYARQHQHTARPRRALIVAMPSTPGLPDGAQLPNVPAEVAAIRPLLPDPFILAEPASTPGDLLIASADIPTKTNVLAQLAGCSIAHFACHGVSDPADPSRSLLLLHDHDIDPLTVASLASVQHDDLQLVYLSACRTAITTTLLNEAIHLTSAFQLSGSGHVIGTLWEINDAIAVQIAANFYRGLSGGSGDLDPDQAARALHQAIRVAREDYAQSPSLWAAYLHAGA